MSSAPRGPEGLARQREPLSDWGAYQLIHPICSGRPAAWAAGYAALRSPVDAEAVEIVAEYAGRLVAWCLCHDRSPNVLWARRLQIIAKLQRAYAEAKSGSAGASMAESGRVSPENVNRAA